jgi:HEAT repeat protein
MRFRRVFVVATVAILLALAAAVFIAFGDFGSSKEPMINGMRLRRYVALGGSGAEQALARTGPDAIPWLIKGLEAEDSALYKFKVRAWKLLPREWQRKWSRRAPIHPATLRFNCVRMLQMYGPEAVAAVPALIRFAKIYTNDNAFAFNALAHMTSDSPEARAFLVGLLRDADGAVKTRVAGAFLNAAFAPPEAGPLLIALVKDYVPPNEHSPTPLNEMMALSVCGPEAAPAAPLLVRYMTPGAPANAITALQATGPAAIVALPRLFEILGDDSEWGRKLRPRVYAILAGLGTNGAAALPALTNGLSDKNPVVRTLAASGIGKITGDIDFALPRLAEQLENAEYPSEHFTIYTPFYPVGIDQRMLAARLLGEMGPRATNALPALKRALNGSHKWVQVFSAEAIWRISKDANTVLPPLIAGLKSSSEARRMFTFNALAQMGPAAEPAVPAIREAMQSDLRVRRYGYVALQSINSTNK